MRVRVLGCSGAIAQGCRTTAFLIDDRLLIDAGTGVGDLTLDEMRLIDEVVLTHAHLDHVAALPLMLDAVGKGRQKPLVVRALPETLDALRRHIFNDVIWPDFTRLPSPEQPFVRLVSMAVGDIFVVGGKRVEVLPAQHSIPAVGLAVDDGDGAWVFSGDTGPCEPFWERLRNIQVRALVLEVAFSSCDESLAQQSGHFCPGTLVFEWDRWLNCPDYPIYITHTKPAETDVIMEELALWSRQFALRHGWAPDVRWLTAGMVLRIP